MLVVAFLGVLLCLAVYAIIDHRITKKEYTEDARRDEINQITRERLAWREVEREFGIRHPSLGLTKPDIHVRIDVQVSVV